MLGLTPPWPPPSAPIFHCPDFPILISQTNRHWVRDLNPLLEDDFCWQLEDADVCNEAYSVVLKDGAASLHFCVWSNETFCYDAMPQSTCPVSSTGA